MIDLIFGIVKDGELQTTNTMAITIYPNKTLVFTKTQSGSVMQSSIEGLQLNPATIVKEFPDLKDQPSNYVKKEGIKRFKEHIKSLGSMMEIKEYLKQDLMKHGYKLIGSRRKGFRYIKET